MEEQTEFRFVVHRPRIGARATLGIMLVCVSVPAAWFVHWAFLSGDFSFLQATVIELILLAVFLIGVILGGFTKRISLDKKHNIMTTWDGFMPSSRHHLGEITSILITDDRVPAGEGTTPVFIVW